MTDSLAGIDQELAAIKAIIDALAPLSPDAQRSAIEFALRRLNVNIDLGGAPLRPTARQEESVQSPYELSVPSTPMRSDIRSLAAAKAPRSAIEMAAVTAYYLSEVAPDSERKPSVTTDDLRKYFKQANYPLPGAIQYTLGNAAAAGFFESAGRGEYRLTPVGHNLVVHGLPADEATSNAARPRRPVKKATKAGGSTKKVAATKTKVPPSKKAAPAKEAAAKKAAPAKKR